MPLRLDEIHPSPPPHLENEILLKRVDLMTVNAKFEAARMGEEGTVWAVTIEKLKRSVLNSLAGPSKKIETVRHD